MGYKRDLFTGELVETDPPEGGREVLYREEVPPHLSQRKTACNPWRTPWESRALAINLNQVDQFNEQMDAEGVQGAHYDPKTGNLVCESRRARREVLKMRGYHDHNAGYGDL